MCQKLKVEELISVLLPARVSSRTTKRITTRAAVVVAAAITAVASAVVPGKNTPTEGCRNWLFLVQRRQKCHGMTHRTAISRSE